MVGDSAGRTPFDQGRVPGNAAGLRLLLPRRPEILPRTTTCTDLDHLPNPRCLDFGLARRTARHRDRPRNSTDAARINRTPPGPPGRTELL
jgi:hypothetical protein